ncbi:aminodeoxychorismate lyase [Bacillus taeanensis]|uniref:aminodeoxychorismate lyase n=1 Tax=Bacillus taeanensis TaxID=273032 RepID=A0A366XUM3_9BACI|nr:aminodeoxychorismate lyase [Bacillus taeanensis]RBW67661.1 4-amino-4-deoxychorismate lyase [Bacillus taeanensis]
MYHYLNGKIVKEENMNISAFDHGYLYGLGVFETFRVYNNHPFLFDDHFERLENSLAELCISWNETRQSIRKSLSDLLQANELTDAYIRLNVSAGVGAVGLQVEPYKDPTVIMYVKPLSSKTVFHPKKGLFLNTKRNTPEGISRLKSHHYLNNIIGKREIGEDPLKEGVFLTESGYIAEGIVSNLFWVKEGVVYTPSLETGILNGITRQFILRLLQANNIPYEIGFYKREQLLSCDEAFMTNSIQEIVPFAQIGTKQLPVKEGCLTNKLITLYNQHREKLWTRKQLT